MIEWIAAGFTLVNVYLAARQNMWTWPVGVVAVLLYLYVFAGAKLYSDAGLQAFFLVMQFYGWYHWARGGVDHSRSTSPVTQLSRRGRLLTVAGAAAWTVAIGSAMHRYTDAAAPYPDAFAAILSVIAQIFMTRKILENWILWIVVDVASVGIYTYKALYPTAVLYAAFLVLCIKGYREWNATRRNGVQGSGAA